MSLKKAWVLVVGMLLVVGMVGCGEKPAPVAEAGPVADPEPVVEPKPVAEVEAVAEPEPVAEEAKQSVPGPEVGRDAAIAEIERLGGTYRCDEESSARPIVEVELSFAQVTDAGVNDLKKALRNCRVTH
jgi:hypothetical protein